MVKWISFWNCSNIVKSVKKHGQCFSLQRCSSLRSTFLMYRNLQSRFKLDQNSNDKGKQLPACSSLSWRDNNATNSSLSTFSHFSTLGIEITLKKLCFFFLYNCFPYYSLSLLIWNFYRNCNVLEKETDISQ